MSVTTQAKFAAALLDPDRAIPEGLAAWNTHQPERRFGVYRNNVAMGLIGALASRFPVTEKIVGKDFFAAMAHEFIQLHPPRSPLLLAYGDDFADFIGTFDPARDIDYLPDVIRLEAARSKAYHAADAVPLDPTLLAAIEPERLASLTFALHPSASILRSSFPTVTIWAMNSGEMELRPIDDWSGEDALLVRPDMTVEIHRLPEGGAVFLEELAAGVDLATAVKAAIAAAPDFNLSANLAGALAAGAFTTIR